MSRLLVLALCAAALGACGGSTATGNTGRAAPARIGVSALIAALRSEDPRPAYELLSEQVRAEISYDEFALRWKKLEAERLDRARALEEGLKGNPNLGERAQLHYDDGRTVYLLREGDAWHLESAVVTQSHAGRPHDAVRLFGEALSAKDYDAVMRVLTERRREGIAKQVETFTASLLRNIDEKIDTIGKDRAELRWEEDGIQYTVILRKENAEWRVDDVRVVPAPPGEDEDEDGDEDSEDELLDL